VTTYQNVVYSVEILYPEFGNQAGENGNALYLRACLPGATFIGTPYGAEPAFATQDVSAVVLSGMTERHQQLAAKALEPYADRLAQLADAGVPMLFTHSAAEILGTSFGTPDGGTAEGLDVMGFTTRLDMPKRYLCSTVGSFVPEDGADPLQILGFKIQFTQMQMRSAAMLKPFCTLERGWGIAEGAGNEGFRRGGLIATWILGPILPTNPQFARWFCEQIVGKPVVLAYEDAACLAYGVRAAELTKPLLKGKTINP
jgi:CobQ-like glutamine amidotransferase family enzyme